ncbi:hypothetical protein FKR81_04835 [Lentzea tibetensis]|uniref:Peptidase inhibitor family I36 n=1 Tax=Lentzea tibetensis TaxID=2591470 RepID=A0A563F006_9PSEU|nr:hypothetical protein [Lentzea tibetensis]TWP53300.1 hypothetical protein FKR81_04835 [Lentzea tibetensis]
MSKLARLASALVMMLPLVMVSMAQPASAAYPDMRQYCGGGYYCLYGNRDWRECIAAFAGNDTNYGNDYCYDGPIGYALDNRTSSVFNNGFYGAPDDIQSFRHPNYVEMIWFVPQGTYYSFVDDWCGALPCNDQASSHRWV